MRKVKANLKLRSLSAGLLVSLLLLIGSVLPITAQKKEKRPGIPTNQQVIHLFSNQGPYGQLYLPKELVAASNEFKLIENQTRKDVFFPSIYFLLSAKPNLKEVYQGMRGELPDYEYENLSQNLEWLKIEISVVVKDCKDQIVYDDEAIRILGLLPDETIARTEDSQASQTVAKTGELANAVVPFFPVASSIVGTSTNVANVLFQNILFPPRLVTYRYSFIDNQRSFGWYWKADEKNNVSLLGMRRGVLLLQAKKGIKSVSLKYNVYAKWNKDVDKKIDDEYVDLDNDLGTIDFKKSSKTCSTLQDEEFFASQNYRYLKNLDGFPMLIPQDVVCDIFQVSKDNCNIWIEELLKTHREITFFTVNRPVLKIDQTTNTIVKTGKTETIKLLRRPDLETLLIDKKKKEEKKETNQ